MITKVRKRDGRIVLFSREKIYGAISKAMNSVNKLDEKLADKLAELVEQGLEINYGKKETPTVEDIQDVIEKTLIKEDQAETAKAYILYRYKRAMIREAKQSLIGKIDDSDLSISALKIAEAKYLQKDKQGNVIETPNEMFLRVAKCIAAVEKLYKRDESYIRDLEKKFYEIISNLEFLPSGRILANAGTKSTALASSFAVPIEDSLESIFTSLLNSVILQKTSAGTGFNFSKIRPSGSRTFEISGKAVGPIPFMHIFNNASDLIRCRGNRKGANMAILRCDHPNIIDFIGAKENVSNLKNFNISVGITDKFLEAVKKREDYEIYDPHSNKVVNNYNARKIFDMIISTAWKNGEPGLLFLDNINKKNPTPELGELDTTSSCAEMPLYPYEGCFLGSINLEKFVKEDKIDYDRLKIVVRLAVRFLDNSIDAADYKIEKVNEMIKANRKLGLGLMGFADLLFALQIPYNSEKALDIAEEIIKFVQKTAREESANLGVEKGNFGNYKKSIFSSKTPMRNATVTAIAPTGSISMLAETSNSIEPNFAICYTRNILDGTQIVIVNKHFEKIAKEKGFYSPSLIKTIVEQGSLEGIEIIPEKIKKAFVMSHQISPEWHVKMQAIFQKYIDNAISKTVNFPFTATLQDVEKTYFKAHEAGCKGITIYRNGSRVEQVINLKEPN